MQLLLYRVFSFLVFVFLAGDALAQTGMMITVAGNGTAGHDGDGGPATSAQLNGPYSVTVDAAGNIFIAELHNHRVRKVTATTGLITTVSGRDEAQYGGDGGPATAAFLNSPQDVAIDAAGNLYIADSQNNRIRKVTAFTGLISTLAGTVSSGYNGEGLAASAWLNHPTGVAVDSAGDIYIAEQHSHRIRKITMSTGMISTVAGNGIGGFSGDGGPAISAQIYSPVHIATDRADNLYIADSQNHRIRKVDRATGIIRTIAGNGFAGFSGDGGSATSARLVDPYGVAVDGSGNIYITDAFNKRIRYVNANTGIISTIAGGGINQNGCAAVTSSLEFPLGLALNTQGSRLYIADYRANRIRMVAITEEISIPRLTGVVPSSGEQGTSQTVTLTGTGFSQRAVGAGSDCIPGVARVSVTGSGVTAANVNVISDTSLSATLTIAPGAMVGVRNVSVITEQGTSNPLQFIVAASTLPPPTLTSITPASGLRGSTTRVTLSGTNFDVSPGSTRIVASGNAISVSDVNVASATSLTATFTIAANAALGNYNVTVVTAGGSSNAVTFAVDPQDLVITSVMPQLLNPTEQVPVQLGLGNPSPDPITGRLTLTFVPNATNSADDPSVSLINAQTSARTVNFRFPANSTAAEFSLPGIVLRAGTVAGVIRLTITEAQVGGKDITLPNNTFDVTVPRLVPAITNVRILNRTSSGFDVEITGYSTSRDITTVSFQFAPAPGADLQTSVIQLDLTSQFTAYYESANSSAVGSSFVYIQPFMIQGDVRAIGSVTVSLSNAQGASLPKTAS